MQSFRKVVVRSPWGMRVRQMAVQRTTMRVRAATPTRARASETNQPPRLRTSETGTETQSDLAIDSFENAVFRDRLVPVGLPRLAPPWKRSRYSIDERNAFTISA